MVIEPRETPETSPNEAAPRSAAHRRFARLVESPVGRRLVPRRLVVAIAASLGFLAGTMILGIWARDWIKGWVDDRPEYQLPFADIKLDPEPPAYIRPGLAGFLEQVRVEAGRPESLPLLKIKPEELILDFKRSPWVERVIGIDRRYRGLTVRLAYRQPVAIAEYPKKDSAGQPIKDASGNPVVGREYIDRSAVILPRDDIDRVVASSECRIRGLDEALITIRDVSSPSDPIAGRTWNRRDLARGVDGQDFEVLGAARLAEFLRTRPRKTAAGNECPLIVVIANYPQAGGYFLQDSRLNWIYWKWAPGGEPPGDPSSVEKWSMLMKRADMGPIRMGRQEFLKFTPEGTAVGRFLREPGGATPRP